MRHALSAAMVRNNQIHIGRHFAVSFQRTLRIPDDCGLATWDHTSRIEVYVHIVNSMLFHEITGKLPPHTPVTARTYSEYGLPWFDLYDEEEGAVARAKIFSRIKMVKQMDKKKGPPPSRMTARSPCRPIR